MTQARNGRRGEVFALRVTPEQRVELERRCASDHGPKRIGPWLLWRALDVLAGNAATSRGSTAPARARRSKNACTVVPARAERLVGNTAAGDGGSSDVVSDRALELPVEQRLILDLCAGTGTWSEPYEKAGYRVQRVTLPRSDVRTFIPPREPVWGVLAAPPCTEFSLAKNGQQRDFVEGMSCVNACVRILTQVRPQWWALENPVGLLSRFLGEPTDVFEPFEFGDPWSKRTALWGDFALPLRGPYVQALDGGGPLCTRCFPDAPRYCSVADHRAVTPAGFARAFFEANP